jgi:uncharacterized YccA/Bax inhibitor family protein
MKEKLIEWIKRYGLAEIISLTSTIVSSWLTFEHTKSNLTTALVATWVGNIGYFGTILIQDILLAIKQLKKIEKKYSLETFFKNIRALFVEFGIAEVFDSIFIRPALLYYFPILLGNRTLGVVIAKFAADITFYIPAIISYELSKKKLRNFE